MIIKFGFKVFLLLAFSFIFYFGSSFIFSSDVKACGETCYRYVDYCYSGDDAYRSPTTCASTESCQYDYQGAHYCYSWTDYPGETYSYFKGSCEYDPACEVTPPPEPECECTSGFCCDGCYFRPSTYTCDSWSEYGCPWGTGCDSDVGIITYTQYCSGSSASCNGNTTDSGWSVAFYCNSWEVCTGSGCVCSGSCLTQPTNPFPSDGAENIKLPATLIWNAVGGARSYRFKIDGVDIDDDVVATNNVTVGDCILKSNKNYNWQVQACCNSNGTNCGPWSDIWNFKTSLAPELLYPKNNATNAPISLTLDWCDVDEAQSYYVMVYKDGIFYYPFPVEKENGALSSETIFGPDVLTKYTTYEWEVATCLTEDNTQCGLDCSEEQEGSECGDYSQRWKFTTGELSLPTPEITSPKSENGIPIVNLSSYLSWKPIGIYGVVSYLYEIKKGGNIVASSSVSIASTSVSFASFWESLKFNETYTGEVKSCWDEEGDKCEEEGSEVLFKTTGAAPNLISPSQNDKNTIIPVNFDWKDVSGALLYKHQIASDSGFNNILKENTTTNSKLSIGYPDLKQESQYYWRVSSCADKKGDFCGGLENIWSKVRNFTTFKLSPPTNPNPENNGELLTSERYIRWEKVLGAKFYQYKVDYQGAEKIPLTIVSTNSALLPMGQLELGEYTWYVQACLDEKCNETSDRAGPWKFNLVQDEGYTKKGIVPCGRNYDNPDTPWNEREPCQFKHIFLLLKNILDFLLWRLGLIVLVLLAVTTGVIYYFSMGAPQTMAKVKSLLKSAGVGYGIIFLGWLIIHWILIVLGFQLGNWWQVIF